MSEQQHYYVFYKDDERVSGGNDVTVLVKASSQEEADAFAEENTIVQDIGQNNYDDYYCWCRGEPFEKQPIRIALDALDSHVEMLVNRCEKNQRGNHVTVYENGRMWEVERFVAVRTAKTCMEATGFDTWEAYLKHWDDRRQRSAYETIDYAYKLYGMGSELSHPFSHDQKESSEPSFDLNYLLNANGASFLPELKQLQRLLHSHVEAMLADGKTWVEINADRDTKNFIERVNQLKPSIWTCTTTFRRARYYTHTNFAMEALAA